MKKVVRTNAQGFRDAMTRLTVYRKKVLTFNQQGEPHE